MGFLAIVNAYAMRICLSLAITEMVVGSESSGEDIVDETLCPAENSTSESSSGNSNGGVYEWDESVQASSDFTLGISSASTKIYQNIVYVTCTIIILVHFAKKCFLGDIP